MSPTLSPSQKRPHKDEPGSPKRQRLGFYSPQFRAVEIDDLDTLLAGQLEDEIFMLRIAERRIFAVGDELDDPHAMMKWLGILGVTATRLAGLLNAQILLHGNASDTAEILSQALTDIMKEFKIQ